MSSHRLVALLFAALGAAVMAAFAFGLWSPPAHPYIGSRLYDFYAQALLQGRFDLPLRELRLEGHYTPGGTGYLYHGLGPLLIRLPFLPFVELPTWWLSPLTIWFWAVAGNACWHRAFVQALGRAGTGVPAAAHALLALAVWFGSPGMFLVANGSVFYEPVAMAYGLGGGFALLLAKAVFGALPIERAVLPLAVLAGLVVHARPHLAVGYYAGVCLLAAWLALRGAGRARLRAAAAVLILGLFGAALLASNALRFRDAAVMHGTFGEGEVQYGMIYWGAEDADGWRARGFKEHGQFNALRILPNAMIYVLSPPYASFTEPAIHALEGANHALADWIGKVRVEIPRGGALFLWPAWMLLMAVGLFKRQLWRMPALAGMAAVSIGALLLLSYATITMRYHADLWPLVAFPALFGIGPAARWLLEAGGGRLAARVLLIVLVCAGIGVTTLVVARSRQFLLEAPGTLSAPWSDEHCLKLTARKGFAEARGRALCGIAGEAVR